MPIGSNPSIDEVRKRDNTIAQALQEVRENNFSETIKKALISCKGCAAQQELDEGQLETLVKVGQMRGTCGCTLSQPTIHIIGINSYSEEGAPPELDEWDNDR